MPVNKQKVHF